MTLEARARQTRSGIGVWRIFANSSFQFRRSQSSNQSSRRRIVDFQLSKGLKRKSMPISSALRRYGSSFCPSHSRVP